ncbi:MAG: NYN domain-containing protein [Nostoc sp. DedVER02]|uniref:IS1/IS1595 family N-terminal zinc-binding domain-containing protein n=1 Tax=unclassified Nostoc TaxID=2593658 RepID=UPI002AD53CB7|nr:MULTISPECIES: NYN domain-containing protein [unclassified Nostoc]MDZ7987184.1 NYN domain-containing protein [Nostoc sp. DedVER02]MDZ8110945.1 NYN domain-containing protein [Nostoc sp. DedVER01b]
MKCPLCESTSYYKNGRCNDQQNYLCKNCGKQFFESALPCSLQMDLLANSNGHTKVSNTDEAELSLVKNLSEEKITEQGLGSFNFILAEELLQTILSPDCLESSVFSQLLLKIQQKNDIKDKLEIGISLLLLDAENLKLDINSELFLASICKFPLQVKIAFANWKNPSIGKQDIELYNRGYQLVHVPEGKNSADAKMIAFGASILRSYPRVKEILVCSSDGILIHLCNELQNQGLIVYWVRRQGQNLHIDNRNTGKLIDYSLAVTTEVPSFEKVKVAETIQHLIKIEEESINAKLDSLVDVAISFQEKCEIEIKHNPSFPEIEKMISILNNSLTESIQEKQEDFTKTSNEKILDELLFKIIQYIQINYPTTKLSVSKLGSELQKITGESPNSIIKKLKLGSSFLKYLKSSPTFTLKASGKEYEVTALLWE